MSRETGNGDSTMKQDWIGAAWVAVALIVGLLVINQNAFAQGAKTKIVHDAEYYILEAQHGEKWTTEDKELDQKLAELRKKFGTPPNIIHIMWDDTAVGEVGIPAIQKVQGFETPHMNRRSVHDLRAPRRCDGEYPD